MASYFRQVPNFEYVSRDIGDKYISEYIPVKNLFKRGKLREDIFANLQFFEKYSIIGDERPDNVAYKFYDEETLDWVVLLSNNILNIQSEWPMTQITFEKVMLERYGTMQEKVKYYKTRYGITNVDENSIPRGDEIAYQVLYDGDHHYETIEIKNSLGITVLKGGLRISPTWETNGNFIKDGISYYYEYWDAGLSNTVQVPSTSFIRPVTNYEYELKIEEEKRNIYILKPIYLSVIFNDMEELMTYKKGGDQYVNSTLKRGDNIRLFE